MHGVKAELIKKPQFTDSRCHQATEYMLLLLTNRVSFIMTERISLAVTDFPRIQMVLSWIVGLGTGCPDLEFSGFSQSLNLK
jgi:hypothetical protein